MKQLKNYILGALVASFIFYLPFLKKRRIVDKRMNENDDGKVRESFTYSSLKTIEYLTAKDLNEHTFFHSSLIGKEVLFHQITDQAEFQYQKYAFAGNIINVYKDANNQIKFDIKLFLSNSNVCMSELQKITKKKISKDLILNGFERSELILA